MGEWGTASAARARLRSDAARIFGAALEAVRPETLVAAACRREAALRAGGPIHVLALGKAALPMARGAAAALGGRFAGALAVSHAAPGAGAVGAAPARCAVVVGDHPLPWRASVAAAAAVEAFVAALEPGARLLVLLSGGTSALVGAPVPGVSLAALRRVTRRLLEGGADIHALNAVRRRLGRWAGGRFALAAAARGARVVTLALSDVPGDAPADVGSGPTVPDATPAATVRRLVRRFALDDDAAVAEALARNPPRVRGGPWRLLGGGDAARGAAVRAARALGYRVVGRAGRRSGEAARVGRQFAIELQEAAHAGRGPLARIDAGELAVTLGRGGPRATGRGGRCQEAALAAALGLEAALGRATSGAPRRYVHLVWCAGTDGRDGPTPAAGAFADDTSAARLRALGQSPERLLARHDSYRAFQALGASIVTGPTGTNVADLYVRLARPFDPSPTR